MKYALLLFGLLDLTVCAIIFKFCFAASSDQKIVMDPVTKQIYCIVNMPICKPIQPTDLNQSDESEEEDIEDDLNAGIYMSETDQLEDFGWEGAIIMELISSQQ